MAERIDGLDGVRGIAIATVVLFHGQRVLGGWLPPLEAGWAGVDLFFVLSGFLITGILRRTRERDGYWRAFALRRALRILPLYLGLLALILGPRALGGLPTTAPWWAYPTFLSNWWIGLRPGTDLTLDITWSLSVEEQFYVAWPVLVALTSRRSLTGLCALLCLASPLFRALLHDPVNEVSYTWTLCRMDAIAWGALAALLRESPSGLRDVVGRVGPLLAGLAGVGLALTGDLRADRTFAVLGLGLAPACFAAWVVAIADRGAGTWLTAGPLPALGRVSYGMYLLHAPVLVGLALVGVPWGVGIPAALGLTWAAALLTWRTIEAPVLAHKERIAAYGPDR